MNKDQVKGRAKTVTGKTKEVAGKLVGDDDLEREGERDQLAGKAKSTYGDLKSDVARSTK